MQAENLLGGRTVEGSIHYLGDAPGKPTFHAKDHHRDNWRPEAYGNEPTWIPGAPHVAFADPDCPAGAGPRISVEARAYAVFDQWKGD